MRKSLTNRKPGNAAFRTSGFYHRPEKAGDATELSKLPLVKACSLLTKRAILLLTRFNVKTRKAIRVTGGEAYFDSIEDKGVMIDLTENVKDYQLKNISAYSRRLVISRSTGNITAIVIATKSSENSLPAGNMK